MMGILFTFAWGVAIGSAGGFVAGLFTADEEDPRQQAIREYVRQVWEEARRAAEEEEQKRLAEYERLIGTDVG